MPIVLDGEDGYPATIKYAWTYKQALQSYPLFGQAPRGKLGVHLLSHITSTQVPFFPSPIYTTIQSINEHKQVHLFFIGGHIEIPTSPRPNR